MPIPAGGSTMGGTAQTTQPQNQQAAAMPSVAFIRASNEHIEQVADVSLLMTTAVQTYPNLSIPAYGYLRNVVLHVIATGGVGAATYTEDGPFNVLQNVVLQEPNGAIISQFNSGYDMFVANKYGGYKAFNDPKARANYAASLTNGNFEFMLRIPLEINERMALGALPNENSAAAFQVRVQLNSQAGVYASGPTTPPTVRVRAWAEEWDQPAQSTNGVPNEVVPPAMNTTQFWTPQVYPVVTGLNTIRLTRVGNYMRNMVFIYRAATRVLGETNWPDVITLFLDARPLAYLQKTIWRSYQYERGGYTYTVGAAIDAVGTQDSGMFMYDFTHEFDGQYGHEQNDLWLPTLGSTRLEIQGNFGAAGTLTVLTNDIAVAGNVFVH
jgi:hypothetical protein